MKTGGAKERFAQNQRQGEKGLSSNGKLSNGHHNDRQYFEMLEKPTSITTLQNICCRYLMPMTVILLCPQLVMVFWFTNAKCDGSYLVLVSHFSDRSIFNGLYEIWTSVSIFNFFTFGVIFGYCVWSLFWMVVLPGRRIEGPETEGGNIPVYKDNGFLHYVVTMAAFAVLTVVLKQYGMSSSIVYDRFGELLAFMNVISVVGCLFLYAKGLLAPSSSDSGHTGNMLFDYYWGTELYPRVLGIDVKVFTNCRFGLTVWSLLVCIYAIKSYETWGFVDSMFVSSLLQLIYITKFFTWEDGYMKTMDIIVDRAGFYICWGCLCWLPSLYPLASQYLVKYPVHLGPVWSTVILGAGVVSIGINYLADVQKQNVRASNGECLVWGRKPVLIRAQYKLQSGEKRSSLLLVSGWWGLSRHFHYIPELLLSFCWSCTGGFENLLPFSYVIYLSILLTHRSFRDDSKCRVKYGDYWKQYCRQVPRRIIPFLF